MKWNEMKWNEMKWNEMKWNEMKWKGVIGSFQSSKTEFVSCEIKKKSCDTSDRSEIE
jgi:hypothetical protein